jgi:hypothetical protein
MSAPTPAASGRTAGAGVVANSGPVLRVLAFTLAAALLYGAVGAFANRAHGAAAMWSAALVQGGASALTTASLSSLIDLVLAWPGRHERAGDGLDRGRRLLKPVPVGLFAALLGALVQGGLHWWVATPELLATVALPAIALLVYCPLYARAAEARAVDGRGNPRPGPVPRR